ncbi:LD-carboxypeptidase LdcB/DacB [Streptococcus suis]|uniref:LD-carboxypeptidase LdcB/DacB n=1 Tax=Streptococcus suis TaxID=1307 RepID=UPI001ABE3558|nr:M15 family metallopeptidase [Streptococcus suis]
MKQRYWLLLGISLTILAACGNSQEKQISENSNQTTQTTKSSREPTYNGTYYYIEGKYGPVIVVNKKHPLASSYAPGEDPTALASFLALLADMQAQGFAVSNQYSGFRSYETQASLYQNYVNQDGQANADRYSARPGYSEHQTGLAFDLIDTDGNLLTEPTACQWLAQHAHEYGFVVRYLEGKEASTGYMPESWHIRYIGQEATEIYQSGLTLEEYYGVEGGDYAQ